MRAWIATLPSITAACLAGIAAGQWLLGSVACRDAIGILFGRGHLLALASGRGIYRADLQRALAEKDEAAGQPLATARSTIGKQDRHPEEDELGILDRLVSNMMVQVFAAEEKLSPSEIDRALELLRRQFGNEKEWKAALRRSGLSAALLRRMISDDLRAERWIRQRIDRQINISTDECRSYYDAHHENFLQPERFRASHLFLAAPAETPPETVEQKRHAIEALSKRLADGEDFFELVALASEDEETKARGGDLGFFSESRMPSDFFDAVRKMQIGHVSPPLRTRLGFHIVQLTDLRPARQMGFDEVTPEIRLRIENAKRQTAVSDLAAEQLRRAHFVRFSH